MVYLTLFYHHGGSFVTKDNGTVVYEVDNVDVQDRLDEDTLDVFAVRNHHHNLRYPKIDNYRWLEPGNPIETGLRSIVHDVDLMEMVRLAKENNNSVHIYYEHVVSDPQVEEEVPQLIEMTPPSPTIKEELWETSEYNRPTAPKIKRKPGPLKTKRRKDANEEPSSSKKPKSTTNLKRQYKEFTCAYCSAKGHTKRSCKHRKADDAAVAEAAAAAATTADAATTDGAANLYETL
ncbi:hypothetical protein PIB30_042853 [Stylosanthes scabra]|uniref:PB1-like domain-containing protein n=1 Tax=Stylosanthes scabra TaxID=79078 RepID=A0ABU6YFN6_9FABA|nr:hypothetical protein [Stylosanthes scabra]